MDAHLSPSKRVLSQLLRDGSRDGIAAFTRIESGIHLAVRLDRIDDADDELILGLTGTLRYADGTPVWFRREGSRLFWQLPAPLDPHLPTVTEAGEVTQSLDRGKVDVLLTDGSAGRTRFVPTTYALRDNRAAGGVGDAGDVRDAGTFTLDVSATARMPAEPGDARPDAGEDDTTEVSVRFSCCGWVSYQPLESFPRARRETSGSGRG